MVSKLSLLPLSFIQSFIFIDNLMNFREIYHSGACNVGGSASSTNPLHQLFDKLLLSDTQQQQSTNQQGVVQSRDVLIRLNQRNLEYGLMNRVWNCEEFMNQQEQNIMEESYFRSQFEHQMFLQEQETLKNNWNQLTLAQNTFQPDSQSQTFEEMLQMMMSDPDPKFKESKFLSLVKKLRSGDSYINQDTITNKINVENRKPHMVDPQYTTVFNPVYTSPILMTTLPSQISYLTLQLNQFPQSFQLWKTLAQLHQENDDDVSAIQCFQKYLQHDPEDIESGISIALSQFNMNLDVDAMRQIQQTIFSHSRFSQLKQLYEDSFTNMEDEIINDSTKRDYNHLLCHLIDDAKRVQQDANLELAIGLLLINIGEHTTALDYLKRAQSIEPDNFRMHNFTGLQLSKLNKYGPSLEKFREAIGLKSNYLQAWVNMANLTFLNKSYSAAAMNYQQAIYINPEKQIFWDRLHDCFQQQGDLEKAMQVKNKDLSFMLSSVQ